MSWAKREAGSAGKRGDCVEGEHGTGDFPAHPKNITARLRALQAIADPALSQLGIASMAHEISSRLSEVLPAEATALHLRDETGDQLTLGLLHGTKRGPHARREIALGEGVLGKVAATGRFSVVENLPHEESGGPPAAQGLCSIIAVPLRCLDRVTGVLSAGTTTRRRFDETDVALVSIAADRLAWAIERTRLGDSERRARSCADNALKARDEFLSMASHELKTPMTSLVLLVQCLLKAESRGIENTDFGSKLESIERQVMRLAQVTERLLDLARIHKSGLGLELGAVDLADVARAAIAQATEELALSNSPVSLHVQKSVVGRWDQKRCEQMLTHLISNAANYGEHRPIEIDVSADSKTARITVRDQGVGIPLQDQQRIFDRYARVSESKYVAGLGMGLWVVRRIAGALGGNVSVQSAPGEGSAFTVELPLAGPAERTSGAFATTM
jgi:signal transduction histidine kinase